ncbi:MAG TPA: CPBP family intramembrane glutamic endopeptidase [Planctomycetota bacterium]|nr:CPBP family intramembrane glutamic endopeptidase [Planctomycetota bacterium]
METKQPELTADARRRAALALLLLVPVPSLGIACEMLWFRGTLGLSLLGVTKVWIFTFPLLWTALVERRPLGVDPPTRAGLRIGLVTGLAGAAVVVLAFQFVLRQRIDSAVVREMARENHLLTPLAYGAVAVYTCTLNSLLEEYVWRWFVLGQLERLLPRRVAVVASALAFTAHHTLLLATQFGAELAVIGSIAVFVAAVTWSAIYARTRSIHGAWLSHALIDVAVFWAGWRILFG